MNPITQALREQKESNPPSEQKLLMMMQAGEETFPAVQRYIDMYKLPYEIVDGQLIATKNPGQRWLAQFVTKHPLTQLMLKEAALCAQCNHEVLITGETGTGKELIAKSMIWDRQGAIRAVNCAGFPETLIESELFGYEKGSFTGAGERKAGLIEAAKDGVMFLDEIGDLPLAMQAKLLRVLQDKKIRRVGAVIDTDINCKFVCATHRDLKKMVLDGQFRQDLFARISTLELHILPLRKRLEDIMPICLSLKGGAAFLQEHSDNLMQGVLPLDLNVRSLQQYVIRYNILGRVINKQVD